MEPTSVPKAETERTNAERRADALQTWGAVARAACLLVGSVALMFSIPVALAAEWLRFACMAAGAVVLIAAGCWLCLWHDAATQVLLQLHGIRRDLVGPRPNADAQEGNAGDAAQ